MGIRVRLALPYHRSRAFESLVSLQYYDHVNVKPLMTYLLPQYESNHNFHDRDDARMLRILSARMFPAADAREITSPRG